MVDANFLANRFIPPAVAPDAHQKIRIERCNEWWDEIEQQLKRKGIRVRRDNWVSVRYDEGLNSSKSSVTLQSTDRHDILGQKSASFQLSLGARDAECAPHGPQDGLLQE